MKYVDLDSKNYAFSHDDVEWDVYSHRSFKNPDVYVVRLLGPNSIEIAVEGLTRGEGMVTLADMLKSLGYRLAKEAFEQEGAVRVHDYKGRSGAGTGCK